MSQHVVRLVKQARVCGWQCLCNMTEWWFGTLGRLSRPFHTYCWLHRLSASVAWWRHAHTEMAPLPKRGFRTPSKIILSLNSFLTTYDLTFNLGFKDLEDLFQKTLDSNIIEDLFPQNNPGYLITPPFLLVTTSPGPRAHRPPHRGEVCGIVTEMTFDSQRFRKRRWDVEWPGVYGGFEGVFHFFQIYIYIYIV